MKRTAALLLLTLLLAGCSWFKSDEGSADHVAEDADKARLCGDPAWKADHLGLWYNLCTKGTVF